MTYPRKHQVIFNGDVKMNFIKANKHRGQIKTVKEILMAYMLLPLCLTTVTFLLNLL